MLSIGALGRGQGNYYVSLAREQGDYYTEGTEPQGRWRGHGAEALGLPPLVHSETFLNVFEGFSPDRERSLTQNAGAESRQPGWDLTFSAPKSVSVLWSQADPETRDAIEWAHELAIEKALGFLEDELTLTRRGKGGKEQEAVDPVIATFDHGTSRAQDPQLHTHCLVLNLGVREDGTTGSVLSHPFYEQKMLLGAIYRAELALQLENQVSLHSEREGRTFEVLGVPEGLCDEFSKRREAIEQALEEKGTFSAEASAWAALGTRASKEPLSRTDLFPVWRDTGREYGFTESEIEHLRHQSGEKLALLKREGEEQVAVREAVQSLLDKGSYFSESELLRETLYHAPGRGFSLDQAHTAVREALEDETQTVRLGIQDGITRYTTPEVRRIHAETIAELEKSQRPGEPRVSESVETSPERLYGKNDREALIEEWKEEGILSPEKNVILTETRAEALELNQAAQDERKRAGVLEEESLAVGTEALFAGDRVFFSKSDRTLGVRSGDFGTVETLLPEENRVEVRLDRTGEASLLPLSDYSSLSLGYAVPSDRVQEIAFENTFMLSDRANKPLLSPVEPDFSLQQDREEASRLRREESELRNLPVTPLLEELQELSL